MLSLLFLFGGAGDGGGVLFHEACGHYWVLVSYVCSVWLTSVSVFLFDALAAILMLGIGAMLYRLVK